MSLRFTIPNISCSQLSGDYSEVKYFKTIVVDVDYFDKLPIPTIWLENVIVVKYIFIAVIMIII